MSIQILTETAIFSSCKPLEYRK